MNKRHPSRATRPLMVAAAAAAFAVTVFVTTATGQPTTTTATTEHFYLHFVGVTSGSPNMKPGATITGKSVVYDKLGGRRLGRTSELCIETVASPLTMQCSMTVIMGANTFTMVGGFDPGKTPYRAALTGGTGRYAGAHGTLLAQTAKGAAENWIITYTSA
jgi:hypothetical protein